MPSGPGPQDPYAVRLVRVQPAQLTLVALYLRIIKFTGISRCVRRQQCSVNPQPITNLDIRQCSRDRQSCATGSRSPNRPVTDTGHVELQAALFSLGDWAERVSRWCRPKPWRSHRDRLDANWLGYVGRCSTQLVPPVAPPAVMMPRGGRARPRSKQDDARQTHPPLCEKPAAAE